MMTVTARMTTIDSGGGPGPGLVASVAITVTTRLVQAEAALDHQTTGTNALVRATSLCMVP